MNDVLQTALVVAFIATLIASRASSWPGIDTLAGSLGTLIIINTLEGGIGGTMDEQQIGQEIGHLNAEYDELFKEVEELYKEVPEATGDPGAYYDMMRMIAAKEGRMERIGDRLAQLYRLREQF